MAKNTERMLYIPANVKAELHRIYSAVRFDWLLWAKQEHFEIPPYWMMR